MVDRQNVAEWFGASFLRLDNYLCLVESNKQRIEEARCKIKAENSETRATPKRVWSGFVLCIAPPSLSRDRRIKMKKSTSIHGGGSRGVGCGGCIPPPAIFNNALDE